MRFVTWARQQALGAGKSIRGNAQAFAAAAKRGAGTAWMNREQILDGIIAAGTIAGGIAALGTGPLGTLAGTGAIISGTQMLTSAVANVQGGSGDPIFKRKARAKKRKRDAADSKTDTAPTADNSGEKQPKISGDQRSRLANMASMR